MKVYICYFGIVFLVLFAIVMLGIIVPFLISAKSTVAVFVGVMLIVMSPVFVVLTSREIYKTLKEEKE